MTLPRLARPGFNAAGCGALNGSISQAGETRFPARQWAYLAVNRRVDAALRQASRTKSSEAIVYEADSWIQMILKALNASNAVARPSATLRARADLRESPMALTI